MSFTLLPHVRSRLALAAPAALAFALVVAGCGSEQTVATDSAAVPAGSKASVADVGASLGPISTADGDSFRFADLDNKPTVVWFWGPG